MNNDEVYNSWKETFPQLAYHLNFIDAKDDEYRTQQKEILAKVVYPKIEEMIDRK